MSQLLDDKFEKLSDNEQQLLQLRHTAEHVLHLAMQNLYPHLLKAMGPATPEGFYFDFDLAEKVSEEDFPNIEKEMQRLIDLNLKMVKEEISESEARRIFGNNPYKNEWVDLIVGRNEPIIIYKMIDANDKVHDLDLCSGPHVNSTKEVKAFKLLKVAGAYWHGDEKNKMLSRIYGTAFPSKEELEKYLWQLDEAKKRDHKKLGAQLGFYLISDEIGSGLILWKPKGAIIRREMEKFIMEEQTKRGYKHVFTPHIGKKQLWVTSGHWDLYRDKMYSPMEIDDIEYMVKPMNCPMHMMIYKSEMHSYKDLPLRIAEDASVYRYEQTGELSGMARGRHFTQDDSHIFCSEEQVTKEFVGVMDYAFYFLESFGIKDYHMQLSIRDPKNKEKYLGDDKVWAAAEEKIKKAVSEKNIKCTVKEGEAAFYGPKLDFMIKDALGRVWQCGTIQIDFMLPERFKLEYTDREGKAKRPVVIHRAIAGSLERFFAILVEHFGGAFPLWLSPVQVVIIPISEHQAGYAKKVEEELKNAGLRVENWEENESMQKRIKLAQEQKIPYMIILGEKEEASGKVSIRERSGKQENLIELNKFVDRLKTEIEHKTIN